MTIAIYEPLIEELRKRSICCYFQNPAQLVVSREQGPAWPFGSNSFWVCHEAGVWYLSTWAPCVYRVLATANLADLCTDFVNRGTVALAAVPVDLVTQYDLIELSPTEMDAFFS
jgi:hypothetical protein